MFSSCSHGGCLFLHNEPAASSEGFFLVSLETTCQVIVQKVPSARTPKIKKQNKERKRRKKKKKELSLF